MHREWIPERNAWKVTSGEHLLEIHERGGAKRPHESLRSAEHVDHPDSGFRGTARPHETRPELEIDVVHTHVREAIAILNNSSGRRPYAFHPDGSATIIVDGKPIAVRFVLGEPTLSVATHDYKHGASDVTVTISKQARAHDIARAAAHELVELQALLQNSATDRAGSLHKGSTDTDLSAHDMGRKAELQILLYEFATKPASEQSRLTNEVNALIEHLGFDPKTVETDPRARKLLGDTLVEGVVMSRSGVPRSIRGPYPTVRTHPRITPADVDAVVATIRSSPRVTDPDGRIEQIARDARTGDIGALGELEALRRWIAEGRTVEMRKPIENETLPSGNPRTNPDFLVDGALTELKTRTEPMAGADWIKKRIRDGGKQIKRSDPDPAKIKPGDVELQLYGPDTRMPLEEMERQVRSELTAVQHRSVKRVAVYHDNVLVGEWIRVGSATVRRFP